MCTLVLLHRPQRAASDAGWPLLLAANRDEMLSRPWLPPAAHWPSQPGVIGGLDTLAGGTWLAMNAAGVVAAVLNGNGSLGPQVGKRSRGELPLLALRHTTAQAAADDLAQLAAGDWRSFNVVIADHHAAFLVRNTSAITAARLAPGFTMVTAAGANDLSQPRIARHLPRFQAAPPPNPPDWATWPELLANSQGPPEAALCIPATSGFGTTSSALIGSAPGRRETRFWVPGT